ncbi:hypothetical protein [Ferrimonas pelagia]|uniref:DUF2946 domain-containing protein n=1 Tax=Ferrimonas pelagia TaxID=1177826 RepID=A0ABP9F0X8_9GAMM
MKPYRLIALLLICWTALLGQSLAILQLAEVGHQSGHEAHFASGSLEQHQHNGCLSERLVGQCGSTLVPDCLLAASVPVPVSVVERPNVSALASERPQPASRGPPFVV